MLTDNEASSDYLNFEGVAEAAASIIAGADGKPISIGISGTWGIGKSSMLRLTRGALEDLTPPEGKRFEFVEFNAWLYQDFDDARTALLDVVASKLRVLAADNPSALGKVREFSQRINWLRVARLAATGIAAGAAGVAAPGVLGLVMAAGQSWFGGNREDAVADTDAAADAVAKESKSILRARAEESPSEEIAALRKSFESALDELGVVLVVFIDDLDRCLPPTTITTLEAIRLLLFMKNTAFVVAADDEMVRFAVRKHYEGLPNEASAINYFDKLIQVPIRVPPLGTQEVRAYLLMLALEDSGELEENELDVFRLALQRRLRESWTGAEVDRSVIDEASESSGHDLSEHLSNRLNLVLRLAPIMTQAPAVAGNPRLIKRFMVALSIRKSMAAAHGVAVEDTVLAKLLLFERLNSTAAYGVLVSAVTSNSDGHFGGVGDLEQMAAGGEELEFPWSEPFMRDWLAMEPSLEATDLRGALYVGRETTRLVQPKDRLAGHALEVLGAILAAPVQATAMSRFDELSEEDRVGVFAGVLDAATSIHDWGAPPLLTPLVALARHSASAADQLASFLASRPSSELTPACVPKIRSEAWAERVFSRWRARADLPTSVAKALPEAEG